MNKVETYAMKILSDHGCDCYTYGGSYFPPEQIIDDLKEAYPNGMEFPYIEVANAILAMSKPVPVKRPKYVMVWDNDSCCDGFGCESFGQAKQDAFDTLLQWMCDESSNWKSETPTEEEKDNWDYMIYNCSVHVDKYNADTDEYEEYWYPSEEELEEIGWKLFNED